MTITEIYEEFSAGSQGFCEAVETHCGYDLARDEIESIASKAKTPEEFQEIWENEAL